MGDDDTLCLDWYEREQAELDAMMAALDSERPPTLGKTAATRPEQAVVTAVQVLVDGNNNTSAYTKRPVLNMQTCRQEHKPATVMRTQSSSNHNVRKRPATTTTSAAAPERHHDLPLEFRRTQPLFAPTPVTQKLNRNQRRRRHKLWKKQAQKIREDNRSSGQR